ncbi:hypothetical protein A3H38_01450 [candidate division WOR-1 bacterium RIFCSPLOWO2_02_FULL_46_20]|uniref:Uncharacterized protein n=2 Tax=Saganbacteria TaxID=1703751 RepID=A0A1F4RE94_UNCSA|nr:MAG: hypothetical protein A3H38_01450 [candidate division WOR-1 bacterium RIFCSPLOWO2_02_FULL_46_20]OGC09292.1 MAG: hypothetical protein A3F86_00340 [candidate division WOR-1 bacterium RIFCSPLOWO2_12_FULL_45_9]
MFEIVIAVGIIIFLLNILQLLSAYKRKREAQHRVKELDIKVEAIKAELEKEKIRLQSELQNTVKKFQEKRS